jgi:hypothetical protein
MNDGDDDRKLNTSIWLGWQSRRGRELRMFCPHVLAEMMEPSGEPERFAVSVPFSCLPSWMRRSLDPAGQDCGGIEPD